MFNRLREGYMGGGSSEQVRAVAAERYVEPALRAGKTRFTVAVRDVIQDLVSQGFPPANTPQVCSALKKKEFLQTYGIEIEGIDGPPSKTSTTVVYRYRKTDQFKTAGPETEIGTTVDREDPDVWVQRVTKNIRGILKDEIAKMGGAEAFIRWVRSEDEESD
jgi:hypothetical protein